MEGFNFFKMLHFTYPTDLIDTCFSRSGVYHMWMLKNLKRPVGDS